MVRNQFGVTGRTWVLGISPGEDQSGCVKPTPETIESGEYKPLSRPLYLYVSTKALQRPEVAEFLKYYLNDGQQLVSEVGYIRLSPAVLEESKTTLQESLAAPTAAPSAEPAAGASGTSNEN